MERDKDLDEAAIQVFLDFDSDIGDAVATDKGGILASDPLLIVLQVVSAAIWDARQDLYSDTLVRNARLATLEREKEKERGRVH
jgi:hypothetical protein